MSPVSTASSRLIYDALKACDIRLLSALPETWLVHLVRMAEDDPDMTLVRLAKEEEGVGISAGAHLAGVKSAMLMQNHGFLAAINGIVSCAQLYRIPLLMLISQRGSFGEKDPWQTEGGGVTEHVHALAYELRDTAFKINVVDPGYTATDFNHHRGPGNVADAAAIIVKYAMIGADGPTGKFFSKDMDGGSEESPW